MSMYQHRVWEWMRATFSLRTCVSQQERNLRFLEEALELVQSLDLSREDAIGLVNYVYDRPLGDPPQEVGGVMVTLAALCAANELDMGIAAYKELDRCWASQDKIRAKQKLKPEHICAKAS